MTVPSEHVSLEGNVSTRSARWKALAAWLLVWSIVFLIPYKDRALLCLALLVLSGELYLQIREGGEFWLRSRLVLTTRGLASHPWIKVMAVLLLWLPGVWLTSPS